MDFSFWALLLVLLGGALGGMARYWVSTQVTARLGGDFPWGTLLVNVTGALLIGLAAAGIEAAGTPEAWQSVWIWGVLGVLGSYTTVSSFSLQTLMLLQRGHGVAALGNVLLSVILCLGAAALAYYALSFVL